MGYKKPLIVSQKMYRPSTLCASFCCQIFSTWNLEHTAGRFMLVLVAFNSNRHELFIESGEAKKNWLPIHKRRDRSVRYSYVCACMCNSPILDIFRMFVCISPNIRKNSNNEKKNYKWASETAIAVAGFSSRLWTHTHTPSHIRIETEAFDGGAAYCKNTTYERGHKSSIDF